MIWGGEQDVGGIAEIYWFVQPRVEEAEVSKWSALSSALC